MISTWYVDFCDTGCCYDEKHKCTYPLIKQGYLTNIFPPSNITKINSLTFTIECEYKFSSVNTIGEWYIEIQIGQLPTIKTKSQGKVNSTIDITVPVNNTKLFLSYINFNEPIPITCIAKFNNEIACPLGIDLQVNFEK